MAVEHRLYLDTNALILLNEGEGKARDLLQQIVTLAASKPTPMLATSALTLSELLVKPYRDRQMQLIDAYRAWFAGLEWLEILPISMEVLDLAALLRATRPAVKLPDAIQLASAIIAGATCFVSADHGITTVDAVDHPNLGRRLMSNLPIIRPDEHALTALLESLSS
jgi:predicted nucleic acid-binding protein